MWCTINQLFVHPVKGCRPLSVDEVQITPAGVTGDREYLVIRDNEKVNLKTLPKLARIIPEPAADGNIRFHAEGFASFEHQRVTATNTGASAEATVNFLLDKVATLDQGPAIADWFSAVVGEAVRVAILPRSFSRNLPVDKLKMVHGVLQNSFVDVAPVMILNQATLTDLSQRISMDIPVERFRPNVVIDGVARFGEDQIASMTVNDLRFDHVAGCERCIIINTDHETGAVNSKQPLKELSDYRRVVEKYDSGIVFGDYFTVTGSGILKVGDQMKISSR